jgi:hypothetical protein
MSDAQQKDYTDVEPEGYIVIFAHGGHIHVKDYGYDNEAGTVDVEHFDGSITVYNRNFIFAIDEDYGDEDEEAADEEASTEGEVPAPSAEELRRMLGLDEN